MAKCEEYPTCGHIDALIAKLPKYDDDRCTCEGCQVVYVRDILAGRDSGRCDCGCYS